MPIKMSNVGASTGARSAICWSYNTSHVLTLGRVPALLADDGWTVRCLHPFGEGDFVGERADGVEYFFGVPYQALGQLRADLYLSPMVGQDRNFPLDARRVHFLVSLDGIEGVYDPAHFDHYDVIALAGRHHLAEFTAHSRARGWVGKSLLPVGYPKLDSQRRRAATTPIRPPGDVPTVVFAPTHGYYVNQRYSVLARYGAAVVECLLAQGMRVVFRPHPESWRDQDRATVERIVRRHQGNDMFEVDQTHDYFDSYARSDAIVTDVSGTGFTFAFTFGRPAVYFAPNRELEIGRSGIQFESREEIGYVARSVEDVATCVRTAVGRAESLRVQIECFRDELIFNPGRSEEYFLDWATTPEGLSA